MVSRMIELAKVSSMNSQLTELTKSYALSNVIVAQTLSALVVLQLSGKGTSKEILLP